MNIFSNPANIIVLSIFFVFLYLFIYKAICININLNKILKVLRSYKKSELIYRFKELNDVLSENTFITDYWGEFRETLVFNDSSKFQTQSDDLYFDTAMNNQSNIYYTCDSNYFFNEETLVNRFLNYKFISSIPGLLTGLGPLGTFLYIAIGFSGVDFSSEENTLNSISNLLSNIEIAAIISILAIGSALCFTIVEKVGYYFLCCKPLNELQLEINRLFDKIPPEKFLIDMVKESKKQNALMNEYINKLPLNIKEAFNESIKANLSPYLENLVFGLNQQKELFSKVVLNKINNDL
ncbi:MAG: hypothetical protein PHV68_02255 [Candidatus Gastranaerophilales bacterium]|nr:hypothetical protein [Candidatus Gastranaerophilales bacterium]